jgi:HPt (histidine-containing phosphotransfer) domain-containing protein
MSRTRRGVPVRSAFANDPEYRELLEIFVAAVPEQRRALETAHRNGASDDLRRVAHQLKGAGGGYGFPELSIRAAELEEACKSQDAARIADSLESVLAYLACISL